MKVSKHELLEQLHEQGIIIEVLQLKIDTYKREIEVYKMKRNKKPAKI